MNVRLLRRILLACVTVGLIQGAAARAEDEIKIGAIGPLSGGGTVWGLAMNRGAQMAADEVNAAGGLEVGDKRLKVRVVMLDDGYTASGARTAADRLINLEKVKYIIGPLGSPSTLATLSATEPASVLLISNGFNPAILKNARKAPFNFRSIDSNIEFAPAMVAWLHKAHPEVKKVGLVVPNEQTQAIIPALKAAYASQGIEFWSEVYDRGTQEFTPLMTRMVSQGVDLFDINSNSPVEGALMIKQSREVGYKGLIWQVGGPAVEETIAALGPLSEGFISLEMFDFNSPAGQKFAAAYHAKWPGVVDAQAPLWYNTARIILEGIHRAGSQDVIAVRDAILGMDGFDAGVFGPVVWGGMADYGVDHQLLVPFLIVEVKDGKEVVIQKISLEKR